MKLRILALDTTAEFGSLALVEDGTVLEELPLHAPDGFGHVLFGRLQPLLDRHGWTIHHVDCYAAASGPGSFTGVRVGLAAAKGLADVCGRPMVAVSNLRAIASLGTHPLRAPLLDARRGDVYGGLYDAQGTELAAETVGPFPEWLASLPRGDIEFLTPSAEMFQTALAGRVLTPVPRVLAGAIGRIAHAVYLAGGAQDPLVVDANYIRRSDAELFWKDG